VGSLAGVGRTRSVSHPTPAHVNQGTAAGAAQTARKPCVCRLVIMEEFVRSLIPALVVLDGSILTALRVHISYFIYYSYSYS
jgi:hypothetical protein